jgi:broad specificity phosphatase PhoE
MLHLVRHGRPVLDRARPAAEWELDPAGFDAVWALRDRLPAGAVWYTSPEPKAVQTAQLLTDGDVGVVEGLREHVRASTWIDELAPVVRAAFADPATAAYEGWEPLGACRRRVTTTVRGLLDQHPRDDLVLVGHGTAWTLLAADLTGEPPDLDRLAELACPDLIVVDPSSGRSSG